MRREACVRATPEFRRHGDTNSNLGRWGSSHGARALVLSTPCSSLASLPLVNRILLPFFRWQNGWWEGVAQLLACCTLAARTGVRQHRGKFACR